MGLGSRSIQNHLKLGAKQGHVLFASKVWGLPTPSTIKPEEREFVMDSGASMHMLSRKELELS